MPAQSRIGDKVSMNCPHGGIGTIVSGSDDVFDNGPGVARKGDTVICDCCGCSGKIVSHSPTVFHDGLGAARINDTTTGICNLGLPCCAHGRAGSIKTGSPTTFLDDGG